MNRLMLTLAMVGWTMAALSSAEPDPRADDRMAIRHAVDSYVAAFNKADAKSLGACDRQ